MKKNHPKLIRNINLILTLILFVKIGGYFSIVEEKSITQIFKVISRIGMTGTIWFILRKLHKYGCSTRLENDHLLAPILYLSYLLLGLASISWSTDPGYSTIQWLMTFESLVFVYLYLKVIIVVNQNFPEKTINLVNLFSHAILPIMIIFIIGSFIEPDTFYRGMRGGEEKRLGGWIMNPNELGMLSSIGAALAYLQLQKNKSKIIPIIALIFNLIILALTSSRSSAIGFLLIIGILILKSNNRKLKIAMIVMMFLLIPVVLKFIIFKDEGGIEEVMSMTGRLPFWTALLNEGIIKEPFFGYGFMRINYTDYFQGLNTYPGKMTHNTFMQVLMNLGFVGFFIAFWQLVSTIRNFVVEKTHMYADYFIAVFIPVIINSFTEFGIYGESNYGITFWHFLTLLFVLKPAVNLSKEEKIRQFLFNGKNN